MRHLALFMAGFLALAFESPLLHRAGLAPFAPDLALIFVLYVGLTSNFQTGLLMALSLGLVKDAFALATPIGMYMEVMVIAFLIVYRISVRLALRSPVGVVILTTVASLGASLMELLLAVIFDRTFGAGGRGTGLVLATMLPQALITAPFGPVVFWLLERLDRLTTRKPESVYL
ncbi:MAG: rod shape-determining protein MreD [Myxococcota bacterium]